jgi:hypothetical protein
MTPEQAMISDQEKQEVEWRSLGATDAAFGELPQYANEAYLLGYVAQIKDLPRDDTGKVQHKPQQFYCWTEGYHGERLLGGDPNDYDPDQWQEC